MPQLVGSKLHSFFFFLLGISSCWNQLPFDFESNAWKEKTGYFGLVVGALKQTLLLSGSLSLSEGLNFQLKGIVTKIFSESC